MTTRPSQGVSAQIISFPRPRRAAAEDQSGQGAGATQTNPRIVVGAWYHEEAVRAERQPKR